MTITNVAEAIQAFESQQEIGSLYDPPISQQAINQWLREGRVPARRVPRMARALRERGFVVEEARLNPDFA